MVVLMTKFWKLWSRETLGGRFLLLIVKDDCAIVKGCKKCLPRFFGYRCPKVEFSMDRRAYLKGHFITRVAFLRKKQPSSLGHVRERVLPQVKNLRLPQAKGVPIWENWFLPRLKKNHYKKMTPPYTPEK